MLTANGGTPPAYRGNTDRLYYGSATFETVDGEVCRRHTTSPKRMPCSISRWNGAPPYYRPKQGFFGCGCVGYTDRTVFTPAYEEILIPDEAVYTLPANAISFYPARNSCSHELRRRSYRAFRHLFDTRPTPTNCGASGITIIYWYRK